MQSLRDSSLLRMNKTTNARTTETGESKNFFETKWHVICGSNQLSKIVVKRMKRKEQIQVKWAAHITSCLH